MTLGSIMFAKYEIIQGNNSVVIDISLPAIHVVHCGFNLFLSFLSAEIEASETTAHPQRRGLGKVLMRS